MRVLIGWLLMIPLSFCGVLVLAWAVGQILRIRITIE